MSNKEVPLNEWGLSYVASSFKTETALHRVRRILGQLTHQRSHRLACRVGWRFRMHICLASIYLA